MSYQGMIATIPLGSGGILSDYPDTVVPLLKVARASNVTLNNNVMEKDFGNKKWNQTAFADSVKAFFDYWPTADFQRLLAVCGNGKVYKLNHAYMTPFEVTPLSVSEPVTILTNGQVYIAEGGAEEEGDLKKAFIFTGQDIVQVITGDLNVRHNISLPPADWTGRNQPTKGIIHRGRMVSFLKHRLYFSSSTDHEDFTTSPLQQSVYPGEGVGISDIFVFKTKLFILKFPFGLYAMDDSDSDITKWTVNKVIGDFGGASVFCGAPVLDDYLIANNFGTLTSLQATLALGDVISADVFNSIKASKFIHKQFKPSSGNARHVLYSPIDRILYVTYEKKGYNFKNAIVQVNFRTPQPEITLNEKNEPNCLGMIRNIYNVGTPYFGASDGFIYSMDSVNRNNGGVAYRSEVVTHDMDFASGDQINAENQKQFDFVEVVYVPTGQVELGVIAYVDGRMVQDSFITLAGEPNSQLDVMVLDSSDVNLKAKTSAECPFSERIPMQAQGRRISIKLYNEGLDENFKILKINVYYKMLEQQQTRK